MDNRFVITFKVDETFDFDGLEQEIYEAVSSYGIEILSQSWQSMIELKIPEKEFSVASVQFSILKLLTFVNTIVREGQNLS